MRAGATLLNGKRQNGPTSFGDMGTLVEDLMLAQSHAQAERETGFPYS